ncbi:MAG: arginase [Glaciecola sp.]|jgi:arginase
MSKRKNIISILGAASDLGANRAGARMGPDAIRIAGLHRKLKQLDYQITDSGNIPVPLRNFGSEGAYNYLIEIADINNTIFEHCYQALQGKKIPLTLGGDHSIAMATVAASAKHFDNLGVIWIDTHADMNNPRSSPSKNIHGMPLSTLLHDGFDELVKLVPNKLNPQNIALIGLRDIDKKEKTLLSDSKMHYYTMRDIDELGIQGIFKDLSNKMLNRLDHLHVSFDLDVMDPIHAPGVSTPVNGGLSTREAHLLLELLYETKKVKACDFVELNPMRDLKGKSAKLMVELITSLFGSTII